MKYIQRVTKFVTCFLRVAALGLSLVAVLALPSLPSTALALGVGVGVPNVAPSISGSDSSKVAAPTNKTAKKYACKGALTVDTANVTKVLVPCGLPYDQKSYACPAGNVIASTGSMDQGSYAPDPTTGAWRNCQNSYYFWSNGLPNLCEGTTQNSVVVNTRGSSWAIILYCRDLCTWGYAQKWVSKPVCYIGCAPQTMSDDSCQWR